MIDVWEDIETDSESDGSEQDTAAQEFEGDSSDDTAPTASTSRGSTRGSSAATRGSSTATRARPGRSPVQYSWEEITEGNALPAIL